MRRRKDIGRNYSGNSIFSARIVCADCGCFYGPRHWGTKEEGSRIVWRCGNKYGKEEKCDSPIITENELRSKFVEALNEIMDNREIVLGRCRDLFESLENTSDLDDEIEEHLRECEIIAELSRKLVEENARSKMNQEAFMRKYNSYSAKYDEESTKVEQLKALRTERLGKAEVISAFMFAIHEQETFIEEFSEKLWLSTIDVVVVGHDGKLIFKFKNGKEIIK